MHLNGKNYLIEHDTILEVIKMIDKNYWLKEWKDMMCGMMYESNFEFPDNKIHCNTLDGIVICDDCRYNIYEGDD